MLITRTWTTRFTVSKRQCEEEVKVRPRYRSSCFPKCRFRPLCLDALQKAGRTWEIVYDGGSIQAIQSAVEAGLGLSVVTPISLKPGIEIVGEKAGLPPLPPCELALYYRKNLTVPAMQKLADFIVEQVTHLENESPQASERGPRKGAKAPALVESY